MTRAPLRVSLLRAGAAYFALVFGAGFLLGSLRVPLLVPRLGVRMAELLEMPLMLVAIVLAARFVVRRFGVEPLQSARLAVGGLALALLILAELLMAGLLQGLNPLQYIATRDPVSGSVYLLMLLVFGGMPAVVLRRQNAG